MTCFSLDGDNIGNEVTGGDKAHVSLSERVMTLRRQTPRTSMIPSPPKVRGHAVTISTHSRSCLVTPLPPTCHPEITIRLDETDALSASSCHDGESERFVSTGLTGRRVSFNESALYEQERMAEDKGRRCAVPVSLENTIKIHLVGESLISDGAPLHFQIHSDRGGFSPPEKSSSDSPPPAAGPVRPQDPHHHGV